ncbi:hypothetical protein GDO81_020241 [Engystomops pustulosus]|uniref:Uncharacterized protein n=1 Tax=Engystomops pustulosus TaxID=76066 RepID=A0AAV6YXX7_ENGPU|nr:hypothetical protein GDO81_020241 [Engystomops pustulosus]
MNELLSRPSSGECRVTRAEAQTLSIYDNVDIGLFLVYIVYSWGYFPVVLQYLKKKYKKKVINDKNLTRCMSDRWYAVFGIWMDHMTYN